MKNLSYSIYFILFNIFLVGQDYLWPTNASKTITAFFAEERPRRYHAGIDIRTYGKLGFETYAIEDGYIEKIKLDYKGYGKTLYLRLNDGNLAVYAHLDKFSPEIDNIINILKLDYNSQVFEHRFDKQEITVKKGEIVGYTGDSGTISGPHLHFEIRDKNNISLNPLLNFYNLEDDIAPIPNKIAIIPKSKETKIDNFSDIKVYDIIKNNDSEYYIADTISVIGDFGISLSILDKVNEQPFSYGLYNLELYIDGEMKYKVEYNEHNFSDGPLVLEERNYNLKRTYKERFYNLYNSTPNLSFIDKRSWPQYKIEPGIHNMIIKAKDINQNSIIIFGMIAAYKNEEIIYNIDETKQSITFEIDEQNNQRNYKLDICNKYNGEKIQSIPIKNKKIIIDKTLLKEPFTIMKLSAKSINGLNTKKYYYQSKENKIDDIKGKFKIKSFKYGSLIQFEESEFSNNNAKINIIKKDTILSYETNRIYQNILTTEMVNINDFDGAIKLEIQYYTKPEVSIKQNIYSSIFYPNQGLYIKKGEFIVDDMTNFINDSMLIWIEDYEIIKNEEINFLTNPYALEPKTLVFKKALDIYFEYENLEKGVGIYYYDEKNKKWIYLKTSYNNNKYSTSVLSNEIFCLIKENNPPEIKNLIPDINSTYKFQDLEKLSFLIDDDLSGISDIKNISIKIDNKDILFEYSPYRKEVYYFFEEYLLEGTHLLEIEVRDNVGNTTTIKGEFIIK